jgi:high-affinity Fe2+/Pb2+ permease
MSEQEIKELVAYFLTGCGIVATIIAVTFLTAIMLDIDEKKAFIYLVIFCTLATIVGYLLKTYAPL